MCRFLLRQKNALNIGNSTDKGSLRFFSFHSLCVHEFKGNKSWGNPQHKILRPSTRHGIWQPLTTASLFLLVAKVNRITMQTIRACKVWRQQFISHVFFSLASFTLFFSYKCFYLLVDKLLTSKICELLVIVSQVCSIAPRTEEVLNKCLLGLRKRKQ